MDILNKSSVLGWEYEYEGIRPTDYDRHHDMAKRASLNALCSTWSKEFADVIAKGI